MHFSAKLFLKSAYSVLAAAGLVWTSSTEAFAKGITENSAGIVMALHTPTYGKFGTHATAQNSQPNLPAKMMMLGGVASFARNDFLMGGRVMVGDTRTEGSGSASYYQKSSMGFTAGYGIGMGEMDISSSLFLGMGKILYGSATASAGSVVETNYFMVEPIFLLGFQLTKNFKLSLGGSYEYPLPYRTSQWGTSVFTTPDEATGGGISYLFHLTFGDFY